MIFACRKDFLPFREKVNLDLKSFPFIWISTHIGEHFSLFLLRLAISQSAVIFLRLSGISFRYNKVQGNFENKNISFPRLYETPLPFFNCIIKKYKVFFRFTRQLLRCREIAQAKSPKLREMEGMISIDLVEAALAHRQFLKFVDDNPCLYTGPHVENAVRRYESVLRIQSRPINANQVIATSPCLPQPWDWVCIVFR